MNNKIQKEASISLSTLFIGLLAFFGVIILLISIVTIVNYNGLVNSKQAVMREMGNIESAIQRRADLIPNLVKIVNQYAKHEKETLANIKQQGKSKEYSTLPVGHDNINYLAEKQQHVNNTINELLAVSDRYPNLKSSDNFITLQSQLEGSENRINISRIYYNEAVADYNSKLYGFFGSMINESFLHYKPASYYKANEKANNYNGVNFD
ncbi:LemA family protein [Pseudofrancisella aestuarii]|uniref:LemA family protein n=1 Tax=Pseudofrancisella aestuarii TaxID=2670347 RepID=A0ABV9TAH8_9GAMM|nr:LemA family protein [Pseudofrancisella aestuarii]